MAVPSARKYNAYVHTARETSSTSQAAEYPLCCHSIRQNIRAAYLGWLPREFLRT